MLYHLASLIYTIPLGSAVGVGTQMSSPPIEFSVNRTVPIIEIEDMPLLSSGLSSESAWSSSASMAVVTCESLLDLAIMGSMCKICLRDR